MYLKNKTKYLFGSKIIQGYLIFSTYSTSDKYILDRHSEANRFVIYASHSYNENVQIFMSHTVHITVVYKCTLLSVFLFGLVTEHP